MQELDVSLLRQVRTQQVEMHRLGLSRLNPASVNRKLTAISRFFEWLVRWDLITKNPVSKVQRPRRLRKAAPYVTGEDFERLLGACTNVQDRALLGCLYIGGLRRAEAAGLRVGDVDLVRDLLTVSGKGGHQRVIPIVERLKEQLASLLHSVDATHADLPVFRDTRGQAMSPKTIDRRFRRICQQAELDHRGYTPHSARHGCGTELGRNGTGAFDIAAYLGHSDPRTTMDYVHSSPEALRQKLSSIAAFVAPRPPDSELQQLNDKMSTMDDKMNQLIASLSGRPEVQLQLLQEPSQARHDETAADALVSSQVPAQ